MGATLPAIARWIKATPEGIAWWGFLYGGNTAGAVFGCLLSGFYLLRVFNMATTTYIGVAINLAVAAVAWTMASRAAPARAGIDATATADEPARSQASASRWPAYVTIAMSGASALGAEIVWTRLLGMLLLATVYVFSIILAVFLFGLALGSAAGSVILRRVRPRYALGWCQIFLAFGIAWTAYSIVHALPYWNDDALLTHDAWRMYALDLKRCIWALLPATLFWGASFPFACAAVAEPGESFRPRCRQRLRSEYARRDTGRTRSQPCADPVDRIPPNRAAAGGRRGTERMRCVSSDPREFQGKLGRPHGFSRPRGLPHGADRSDSRRSDRVRAPHGPQCRAIARSCIRKKAATLQSPSLNGITAPIYVNVNGHVEATTEIFDMKLQRMVGHLPALLHPDPRPYSGSVSARASPQARSPVTPRYAR